MGMNAIYGARFKYILIRREAKNQCDMYLEATFALLFFGFNVDKNSLTVVSACFTHTKICYLDFKC